MLSSRFDPSCTGFSSKKRTSTNKKPHGLSFPVSPAPDSFNQKANFSGGEESASADNTSKHPGPRKRRHYYEILPRDLETSLVLNRRIKIFWPLDESWYDGLVNNYHAETNLYHVKYDDRDEEWVDLQEEKFKLLLFPSEVPGKAKRKRHKSRDKVVHSVKTVPPPDNDRCIENNLDSEPIASWLARSTQRVKSSLKSRTSQMNLSVSQPLSSDKTDNSHSNSNVSDSHTAKNLADRESALPDKLVVDGGVDKSVLQDASSQNEIFLVYSRRKYKKRSSSTSLVPVSLPTTKADKRCEDFEKQLWSIDDKGDLSFNFMLVDSKKFRMQICLPILPFLEFSNGTEDFWLLHNILMLQHGTIVTTSPAVKMEIFLLDSTRGLRFLLFEGCLMQALAFVFLILVVFNPPDEQWNGDVQLPLTSISFRLSSVQDLRKHHVFAFYSFSELRSSKWLFLDSKLLQSCLLIKQLPVSECTYDNIKDLDNGSAQQRKSHIGLDVSSFQGCKKKFVSGILPMCFSNKACSKRMSLSTFDLAAKLGKVPQFALSFSAAPTFFRDLHLQLLMQHSFAWVNLQHLDTLCSIESSENGNQPVGENDTQFKPSLVRVEDIAAEQSFGTLETEVPVFKLSSSEHDMGTNASANNSTAKFESSQSLQLQKINRDSAGSEDTLEVIAHSNKEDPTSNSRCDSRSGGMIVDIPSLDQVDMPFDGKGCISRQTSDMEWNPLDDFVNSPNPTGSRSSSRRTRSSSISSLLGNLSPVFPDGKASFMRNGFSSGPKKPRTQVRYTLPYAGYDFSAKQKMQNKRAIPCKRIRRSSLKRLSDGSKSIQKNFELLSCSANILVTLGDKGWRECGAHVVLEVADHNEWRLAVKLSGITKYSYKVKHILQPGSTNRYSHAMMWKGGKDWLLEFPDRSQWMLFKEMHEECYNLNIRAASLKNIPIPGVQLIEENDDCGTEVTFVRNSVMYFRQVQNDVEMAMDPSRVLYDMDSDDEQWFLAYKACTDKHRCEEITEEFLEKTIGIFEKVAYIQQRDKFTDAEIEELVIGIGSAEAAKVIYEHWRQKREKKGMPLIRHLQSSHWERYQQQLKEWEHTIARGTGAISVPPPEKPPMFAFCLKPRGLDVPNKGFKQRSHRKYPVSGHHHATSGDPNNLLVSGRRSNGRTFGDGKVVYRSSLHEYKNGSPSLQASRKVLSPQDAHFSPSGVAEWNHDRKVNGNKPNKLGSNSSYYNQRTVLNGNEVQQWNIGSPVLTNQRHYYYKQGIEQLNGAELNEFQLRDVSGVAEHAVKMAKLKREKAQRLLNRADVTIHKAVVAIMTAEAIKAAHENTNGDN
ncbi:hypothetical protein ACJIZ3_001536 [Penstemon smallii]|uniref:Enhancer of polycomb-like protein n=1 Tax=Penstemon smallii TaxID=265156 RepID=A0ABD3U6C6_9LAMI